MVFETYFYFDHYILTSYSSLTILRQILLSVTSDVRY